MIKVGITGGIGSGKSVVSKILRELGYPVYDTDLEARRLMQESLVLRNALQNLFGKETYREDGLLNRPYLASVIFKNPEALQRMNCLVHPVVRNDFEEWSLRQQNPVVFVESAILQESGFDKLLDQIWVVSAPDKLRIERVINRDGTSAEQIRARMNAQLSQDEKERSADLILHNDGCEPLLPQLQKAISALNQ